MRSVLLILFSSALGTHAQTADIKESCAAIHMNCSYNSRYNVIDTIYRATGKALFDKASNPFTRDAKDGPELDTKPPRFYIGSLTQNQKLARNIAANKQLFVSGKLSPAAAKKWRFVN